MALSVLLIKCIARPLVVLLMGVAVLQFILILQIKIFMDAGMAELKLSLGLVSFRRNYKFPSLTVSDEYAKHYASPESCSLPRK